jgi:wyosine [tRNA(Phe)-imidazoG37] synthetase (radical SAM superfamily)
LKQEFPAVKVAVLTNSSLLYEEEVRRDLMEADIVLPSLDAATELAYLKIDRPEHSIKLDRIISGIADFTAEFKSQSAGTKEVWLEVFIIEGINTDQENIERLRDACLLIKPDRVQLNTLDRPGTESWVKPASKETLERILEELKLPNVEIISAFRSRDEIRHYRKDVENAILDTISRRPSTIDDLRQALGLGLPELAKYLDVLEHDKAIMREIQSGDNSRGVFYRMRPGK